MQTDERRVKYEYFRGTMASWNELFTEAAEFATRVGPDSLIGFLIPKTRMTE